MSKILHRGQVLVVTDDVAAACKDLTLVTLDRAHGLVSGGHATWLEPPEEAKTEPATAADDSGPGVAAACDDLTADAPDPAQHDG